MDLLFIRDILVLIVTLGFGVYFSYTDISRRIIPNYPLVGYLVFGLVINILFIVSEPALTKNILSALGLTLAISFGVYYFNIWHAGDSKLYLATTFNIIPFAVKPLSMALLNFCLPLAVCYVLMFPWLLARAMVSKRRHSRNPLWFVIKKATRSVLSLERPLQVIVISAIAGLLPFHNVDISIRAIMLFLISRLFFSPLRKKLLSFLKEKIKLWYFYGIISIGLLVFIKITNGPFSPVSLLSLLGFVYFFSFYRVLEFHSRLKLLPLRQLEEGMELGANIYQSGNGEILASSTPPKGAKMLFKESQLLAESDIDSLQKLSDEKSKSFIPVGDIHSRPLPFAPFIIASALFIMVKLLRLL